MIGSTEQAGERGPVPVLHAALFMPDRSMIYSPDTDRRGSENMEYLAVRDVELPDYEKNEELLNTVTHAAGAVMAAFVLVSGLLVAVRNRKSLAVPSCCIYGLSMFVLYAVSAVYHGLPKGNAKRLMRVIDHCTIYLLIAGSYTPILLTAIRPEHPTLAWTVFAAEWGLGLIAAVLTAINLKKSSRLSMICYIVMGWLVAAALKPTIAALSWKGFAWLLAGGVCYTVGAVLYKAGKKKRYFHTVFHVFVVLASLLQAVCILRYVF